MLPADNNDFNQVFKYGYASDGEHQQLLKLDVETLKPVKLISLSRYQCLPMSSVFLHTGDYHCQSSSSLVCISLHHGLF